MARRTRRNPEWSWALLDDIFPRIQASVPEELWPVVKNPVVVEEYGAGFYGVAMPTRDRRFVFKLTTDPGEAGWASMCISGAVLTLDKNKAGRPVDGPPVGINYPPAGAVKYLLAYDSGLKALTEEQAVDGFGPSTVFLLWREAADPVGEKAYNTFVGTDAVKGKRPPDVAARAEWAGAMDVALQETSLVYRLQYHHFPFATLGKDFQDALRNATAAYTHAAKQGVAVEAARSLAMLARQGVFCADHHRGNWGVVDGALTLIDPGRAMFFDPKTWEARKPIALPKLPR